SNLDGIRTDRPSLAFHDYVSCLKTEVNKVTRKIPLTSNNRSIKPWMSFALLQKVREKNKLYVLHKKHPEDFQLAVKYRRLKNNVQKVLKQAKLQYYSTKLEDYNSDLRRQYDTLKDYLNLQNNNVKNFSHWDKEDSKELANEFNKFFAEIGSKIES